MYVSETTGKLARSVFALDALPALAPPGAVLVGSLGPVVASSPLETSLATAQLPSQLA